MVCEASYVFYCKDYIYIYMYLYYIYIIGLCIIYISLKTKDNSYKLECTKALIIFFRKTFFFFVQQESTLNLHKKYKLENKVAFYYI